MMPPRDEWHLDTRHVGRRVLRFDQLASTNDYAASLADDLSNDGIVILADTQSAGRGQHGRSWHCPPGHGVLLSALVFPPPPLRRPVVLAAWATVAVCETVQRLTGLDPRIKWPNDVFVRERKVCGILVEQGRGTVMGIGLNVNQPATAFAAAGLPEAASLASLTGKHFEVAAIARLLIEDLDRTYAELLTGATDAVEARWRARIGLMDQIVAVETPALTHKGQLQALSFDALVLTGGVRLSPESVRHLRAV